MSEGNFICIFDYWRILKMLPEDCSTVHVDIQRGTREYDVLMEMKGIGHIYVGEEGGFIDRVALAPLGHRIYLDKKAEWELCEDDGGWIIKQLTEQWQRAYKSRKLPWQINTLNNGKRTQMD